VTNHLLNQLHVGYPTSTLTRTATRSCLDPEMAVIHSWSPGGVRRMSQRAAFAATAAAAATTAAATAAATARAGLRHVRGVRPNRAAKFREPQIWTLQTLICQFERL